MQELTAPKTLAKSETLRALPVTTKTIIYKLYSTPNKVT